MAMSSSVIPAQMAATTCPLAWSAAAFPVVPVSNLEIYGATCAVMPLRQRLLQCIQGGSFELQTAVINSIIAFHKSDRFYADYIGVILAYLENFTILIASKGYQELEKDPFHATYRQANRLLVIKDTFILPRDYETLRHELRHAYWHTIHLYTIGKEAARPYCFSPITQTIRREVATYIKKGDERIANLKKNLFAESQNTLSFKTVENLNALRRACEPTKNIYFRVIQNTMSEAQVRKYEVGKIYTQKDVPPVVVGKFKVVDRGFQPGSYLAMELLDPLRALVHSVEQAQNIVQTYKQDDREFEREAYLIGAVPLTLIKKYYPELLNYTISLSSRYMARPNPLAMGTLPLRDYSILEDQLISLEDKMVDKLVQTGMTRGNANLFIARMAKIKNNDLLVSRCCRRAFKQNADFTLKDYLDCLDSLMIQNQWGDAKIICQKARAKYADHLPQELKDRWKRIQDYRQGI